VALILMVGSACSQPSDGLSGGSPGSELSPSTTPPARLAKATCTVATPSTWTAQIERSTVVLPPGSRVVPFATGPDPSVFFAELYSAAWSGVISVAAGSGAITHIAPFRDPSNQQAYAGGFDGRWLVWVELLSLEDSNDWQMWAWDSSANQSFELAAAPTINGSHVPGPFVQPVVSGGKAAWAEPNQAGIGEVHLYSLADRRDEVVGSNATYPVLFWGSDLVWQQVDPSGQSWQLQMLDVATHQPIPVPAPLRTASRAASLAVSDGLVAWTDGTSIWAYRVGQSTATLVYQVAGDTAGLLAIAGDLVTWDGSSRPFALDVRTAAVTTITPVYGGRFASGRSLLIYWPSGQTKAASGALSISDVDAATLPPLPSCG
jgi:hypothetical protein